MPELIRAVAVEALPPHRLRLAFQDGTGGIVDLSGRVWRGAFEPFSRSELLRACQYRRGTRHGQGQPNGADIAPETLYAWVHDKRGSDP